MNPYHISRAKIDTIVERKIEEFSEDPRNTLTKFMSTKHFFSSGPFQIPVFSILQHLTSLTDSPFFTTIQRLLKQTSHSAIKNFSINLGYNSWTCGAQTIRDNSPKVGCNIPWITIFRWNPESKQGLTPTTMDQMITDCNKLGVFSFCIRQEQPFPISGDIFELLTKHPDCTFFWFIPNQTLAPIHLDMIQKCENLLVALDGDGSHCLKNTHELKNRNVLYATYHTYSSFDGSLFISESWIDYYKIYDGAFHFLIASDHCNYDICQEISDYVAKTRPTHKYPFILSDFYSDIAKINRIISGESFILELNSDGSLLYPKSKDFMTLKKYFHTNLPNHHKKDVS